MDKIFAKLIKTTIYENLDLNQGAEQAGFRKNYSTIDHISM